MSRDNFLLKGVEYPLAHLNSFRVTVPAKDPLIDPAILQVTFSCHVFSEKWRNDEHEPEYRFRENSEERAFCPIRYGCSIGLQNIIDFHIAGKAFEGRDGNGNLNHFFYADADGISYPVYFRLGKANKIPGVDGILHIISAYQNPDLRARHRFQSIKFARLVHQICKPKTK